MYRLTLYSAVIVAVVPGIIKSEQQNDESAVLVKINPFISKSRRVIQFGGDGRYKRNGPEKSALYLEFPESFFEDPKLKRLYRSLIGERDPGDHLKVGAPEKTDIVFQIDPSAFGKEEAKQRKRDVRREELAAFQLRIEPASSRQKQMGRGLQGFVPRLVTTKAWCVEGEPVAEWSPEPLDEGTQEPNTELVTETMCYPSKPSTMMLRICGATPPETVKPGRQNDPCQCHKEVDSKDDQQVDTTPYDLYTNCRSQNPVITHHVESLCFTTERCRPRTTYAPYAVDVFSTTYKPIPKPSCLPSSTPACAPSAPSTPFQRFMKRRRKDNQVRNFFVLSNSPPSCPPFCPAKCTKMKPKDCPRTTKCPPSTCSTTCTTTCPTTCSTTCPTTCSPLCPTTCSTTCPTTCSTPCPNDCPTMCPACTEDRCPVKRERADDPLRNVLRVFHRTNPIRRVRRNPPPVRRRRHVWIYKPKHGLRKISFRTGEYAPSLQ